MEKISELMDGELDSREASVHVKRLKDESTLRENWDLYHLVGDAIRKETALSIDISKAVSARLAAEPTVMAPRFTAPRRTMTRYAMSAAAGLAGIAVVAWVAVNNSQLGQGPAILATTHTAPMTAATTSPPTVPTQAVAQPTQFSDPASAIILAQDAEVEDYLLAHRAISSFTTMHGSLPYVRAVASDPARE